MKNKTKRYSAQWFYEKFKAIPASKWCVEKLQDGEQRCVFGHCGGYDTRTATRLNAIFRSGLNDVGPISVNDARCEWKNATQKTPRGRILAALRFIIKKERQTTN